MIGENNEKNDRPDSRRLGKHRARLPTQRESGVVDHVQRSLSVRPGEWPDSVLCGFDLCCARRANHGRSRWGMRARPISIHHLGRPGARRWIGYLGWRIESLSSKHDSATMPPDCTVQSVYVAYSGEVLPCAPGGVQPWIHQSRHRIFYFPDDPADVDVYRSKTYPLLEGTCDCEQGHL